MHEMGPRDPSTIFLATSLTRKVSESAGLIYSESSISMLENIYHNFTLRENYKKLRILLQFSSSYPRPITGSKFAISCKIDPIQITSCHVS